LPAFHSPAAGRPYALTRPSLLLLEQLTIAIGNREPLLLVGETGTGKTTSVTHLAALLRRPLVSLNLSTQTESSDLLGGFKPLDPKLPAAELMGSWLSLFERTFSRKKKTNRAFEDVLRKVVGGAKWGRAVEMWRKSRSLAWERLGKQVEGAEDDAVEDDS
jgi:midasin